MFDIYIQSDEFAHDYEEYLSFCKEMEEFYERNEA